MTKPSGQTYELVDDLVHNAMSNPTLRSGLDKAVENLDVKNLRKIVIGPNFKVDHSNHLHGCVIVVSGDHRCDKLFTMHDLLSAVSYYEIKQVTNSVDEFLSLINWDGVLDLSIGYNKPKEYTEIQRILHLPEHNASVGFYPITERNVQKNYIIVRAYNQFAVEELKKFAMGKKCFDVYTSREYKKAHEACQKTRDALAAKAAEILGAIGDSREILNVEGEVLTGLNPKLTAKFNYLTNSKSNPSLLSFYNHSFDLGEVRAIPYGISREEGYMLYGSKNLSDESAKWFTGGPANREYTSRFENIFPIGTPHTIYSQNASKTQIAKQKPGEKKKEDIEYITWGGNFRYHHKLHDVDLPLDFHTKAEWTNFLAKAGFQISHGEQAFYPAAVLISAPHHATESIDIDKVIKKLASKTVKIPLRNPGTETLLTNWRKYTLVHHDGPNKIDLDELVIRVDKEGLVNINADLYNKIKKFVHDK